MHIQRIQSSKTENFSYKNTIEKIAMSELFSQEAFKLDEPIFIVKFTSSINKVSQVNELAAQETKQKVSYQGLLFESQINELEKNPESFNQIFLNFPHSILLVTKEYCSAFAKFGMNTSMSKEFEAFQEKQKKINNKIFEVVTSSEFKVSDYELICFEKGGYRTAFLDSSNNYWIEPILFNYIDGCVNNHYYDLNKVKNMILNNPDIVFNFKVSYSKYKNAEPSQLSEKEKALIIEEIPYYNQDEDRTHGISFYWKPDHSSAKSVIEATKKIDSIVKEYNKKGIFPIYDWKTYLFYELLNGKSAMKT